MNTTVKETLEKLIQQPTWKVVPGIDINQLAPKIETALQAVADAVEDVYKEIYHEGSALDEGIKSACVATGIEKLSET